jgi:hemerythrin-like domain-containing protein
MTARNVRNATQAKAESFMLRLRSDHAGMSRILREIDAQQSRLVTQPKTSRPVLIEAMRYLLQYQHASHHPREDRLFARIRAREPGTHPEIRRLVRQHRVGLRRAEDITDILVRNGPSQLRGPRGVQLQGLLQKYVRYTRQHMRLEEALFYARSESVLRAADWRELTASDERADPMSDLGRLEKRYPRLAARLAQPVHEISGNGVAASSVWRPAQGTLRPSLEQLIETCGGLTHDLLDLARANVHSVRGVRSLPGLWRAARPIHERTWTFARRCITEPVSWAVDAIGSLRASGSGPPTSTRVRR